MYYVTLFYIFGFISAASYNDRYAKEYGTRDFAVDEQPVMTYPRPITHTFPNRTQCLELCELPCTITNVYIGNKNIEMYTCAKLRPPKVSMLGSIKANSFYMTLLVLGAITAGIVVLLTLCFCCSYCCRQPVSSRGSSKDALNPQDDGEFREYLNENEIGIVRKEREFSRRPRGTPHVV
uniref:Protein shisa-5 n=1 Tax=Heterorhabditis bacteriophora TaxID=37862 RepID=A0A1I7X4U0_HETBA